MLSGNLAFAGKQLDRYGDAHVIAPQLALIMVAKVFVCDLQRIELSNDNIEEFPPDLLALWSCQAIEMSNTP